jgi:SAM-dependent methyltransferase
VSTDTKTSRPWYADWFGRDYLDVYSHRDKSEAVRQIDLMTRSLQLAPGARVLDLCCGGGRHSIEMARRGYSVVGVDLSAELLEQARESATGSHTSVEFIRADMRCVITPGGFDVVANFFTSFGYFDTDDENQRVLDAIRASLRPGGTWMLDYLNRDHIVANLAPPDERTIGEINVRQERSIDTDRGRINKILTVQRDGQSRVYRESVRMFTFPELKRMIHDAGLRITSVYGESDGRPFGLRSPRLVLAGTTR